MDGALRSICRTDAASRRCIQEAGEIMFVPDMWGHEIFNLEPTVGVQAMYTTGETPAAAKVAGVVHA